MQRFFCSCGENSSDGDSRHSRIYDDKSNRNLMFGESNSVSANRTLDVEWDLIAFINSLLFNTSS